MVAYCGRARLVACLCGLQAPVEAKRILREVILGPNNVWDFLTQFSYDLGAGQYAARVRVYPFTIPAEVPVTVQLETHVDTTWSEVEALDPCSRWHSSPSVVAVRSLHVDPGGNWSEWARGLLHQIRQPHFWIFGVSTCGTNLEHDVSFLIELDTLQPDGSPVDADLAHMPFASCVIMIQSFVFAAWYARWRPRVWPRVIEAALVLQLLCHWQQVVHFVALAQDGVGAPLHSVASRFLFTASQIITVSLLLGAVKGHLITQISCPLQCPNRRNGSLVCLITCAQAGLLALAMYFRQDGAPAMYHELQRTGKFDCLAWLLFEVLFVGSVRTPGASRVLRSRWRKATREFILFGSCYFLALPTTFVVCLFVATYWQFFVMRVILQMAQWFVTVWLARLYLANEVTRSCGPVKETPV